MNKDQTHYKIKKLIKGYEKRYGNVQEAFKKATDSIVETEFSPESIATTFEVDTLTAESALIEEFIADLNGLMDE